MPLWIVLLLKKHWKVILYVILIFGAYLYFRQSSDGWAKKYEEVQKNHVLEIKQIENAREEEKKLHEKNVKQLQDEILTIKNQYNEQLRLLENKKKATVKKIIEENGQNPKELAKQLSELTGLRVQLTGEQP